MHWIESLVTSSNGCHLPLLPEVTWLLSISQACHRSNSGYNTMSTIMKPLIMSSIQHHRETSYNISRYTTYIQRYASNHSILMTNDISRYISLISGVCNMYSVGSVYNLYSVCNLWSVCNVCSVHSMCSVWNVWNLCSVLSGCNVCSVWYVCSVCYVYSICNVCCVCFV